MDYSQADIHPHAYIASNATIIGNVTLAEKSTVLFNAVLRGDVAPISVGRGSNIQENCSLHVDYDAPCIIGKNVTIGHNAVIHGCTIEDTTLVGMGAIIMNDAHIGKNCLIAAGALVTQGTIVPDGSLVVGSPAKVKRPLTSEEIEANQRAADEYQEVGLDLKENGIIYSGATLPRGIMTIAQK